MKKPLFYLVVLIVLIGSALIYLQNAPRQQTSARIFFLKGGSPVSVERKIPEKADIYYFVTTQLLAGPTAKEAKRGLYSQVPKGTKIRTVIRENGTVRADFSKELETYGGGTASVKGMLSQIVYTLTDIQGVRDVQIIVSGKREVALGGEGFMIEKPLTRKDVEN